jgi:hypothetical protein
MLCDHLDRMQVNHCGDHEQAWQVALRGSLMPKHLVLIYVLQKSALMAFLVCIFRACQE